jgi:hypothetical protein
MFKFPKIRYRQKEMMLIFVTVFGLIGSVVIYRSYAKTLPNTNSPGEYSITSFIKAGGYNTTTINGLDAVYIKAGDRLVITLKNKEGLNYCLMGWNSSDSSLEVTALGFTENFTKTGAHLPEPGIPPAKLGCFTGRTTSNRAEFTIQAKDTFISSILVSD